MLNKRLLTLVFLLPLLSACAEPTSTQRGYIGQRDLCREMSELRISPQMRRASRPNSKEYKHALLHGFKNCMEQRGWSVTGPEEEALAAGQNTATNAAGTYGEAPVPVQVQPLQTPPQTMENPNVRRAAECSYARQAKNHSSNARAIAKACDIECANEKHVAPDMPLPAACPQ